MKYTGTSTRASCLYIAKRIRIMCLYPTTPYRPRNKNERDCMTFYYTFVNYHTVIVWLATVHVIASLPGPTDNMLSQQFYCGHALSLSLQLTTTLLQHCVNTLQACPIMSSLDNISVSGSSLPPEPSAGANIDSLKSCDQPQKSRDQPEDSNVVSEFPKDLMVCLDVFSVLLPAVRVWLQWLLRQKALWTQWVEHFNKSAM